MLRAGFGLGFVSGALAGRVFPVGPQVTIGRDPSVEVALPVETEGVSTRHAQVVAVRGGDAWRLVDLGSRTGTWVDGERVTQGDGVPIIAGSVIRFGAAGPLAVFDDQAVLNRAFRPLALRREGGEAHPVAGPVVLGRDGGCDVVLDVRRDAVASSRHAHVLPAFGRVVVTDLGSANGTFVDGLRCAQRLAKAGAVIELGRPDGPRFFVEPLAAGAAPPPTAPVPRPTATPRPGGESGRRRPAAALPSVAAGGKKPIELEQFRLEVVANGRRGRVFGFVKTEASFGSYAGINDIVLRCFPRELESDRDALDRSESIGPHHGTLRLTRDGFALEDGGAGPTKLNGAPVPAEATVPLPDVAEVDLGEDVLGLRARLFRHPRLAPTDPALGLEAKHPVECLVLERKGDGADHLYLLLVRQATIGAADECALCIPAPGVTPVHANLFVRHGALWLSRTGEGPVAVAQGSGVVPLEPGTAVQLALGAKFWIGTATFELSEVSPEDFDPPTE